MSQPKQPTPHYQNLGGINEKASKYATGLMEFLNLVNFDLNTPGAISKRPGSTAFLVAGTSGYVQEMHEFRRLNGFSQVVVSANNGLYYITPGRTLAPIVQTLLYNSRTDMLTFVDWMWAANGQTLMKYDGTNIQPFGFGITAPGGIILSAVGGSAGTLKASRYMLGYINSLGSFSHVDRNRMFLADWTVFGGVTSNVISLSQLATSATFGISYMAIYRNDDFETQGISYFIGVSFFYRRTGVFYFLDKIPIGATQYIDSAGHTSLVNQPITANKEFYWPSYLDDTGTTRIVRAPQHLELHQNSMFMAGFSFTPSTVWFSEVGDPEDIQPDFNFEVRTNDGDVVRGMKTFGNQLLVFKENSFHRVIGDNPNNYEIDEISTEYGAISDKAIITVDGICYFLDQRGIVQYNGASWELISDRMESTFNRMNLDPTTQNARNIAVAVHHARRHQIWFSFPIDTSIVNNMTVVYDYKAKALFKFEGFVPASMKVMDAGLRSRQLFAGDFSGMIGLFGATLLADNGVAMTLIAQPRFDQPQGPSVTAQFRRLWLDSDPVTGLTGVISVSILKDMSQTSITTMSVYQNKFQSRLEFGVQAKAIGFVFSHRSASLPCTINGWVVGHKILRDL